MTSAVISNDSANGSVRKVDIASSINDSDVSGIIGSSSFSGRIASGAIGVLTRASVVLASFLGLTDTPSTYSGASGKVPMVKSSEDGLEFQTISLNDEKVKYDASDPTAGYVADKFVAGYGITLGEGTGADENKLKITANFDWLIPPIIDWYDPVAEGGLPVAPEIGDRYGADSTGYGWTIDYIYEWDGVEWVESAPEEGWMLWDLLGLIFWVFFSGGWMEVGSDSFWSITENQMGLTGDKSGSFDLTTTGNVEADALVTTGGTSSDFVKGDGSLDSSTYLTSVAFADLTDYPADAVGVLTNDGVGNLSWGIGGYTNLTSFVDQTAWRLFYSNVDGDVTEFAFGDVGKVLTSGGTSAVPTWETPFSWDYDYDDLINTPDLSGYALLDGSNQPFTGDIEVSKANPEFRLTETGNDYFSRLYRENIGNYMYLKNEINLTNAGTATSYNGTNQQGYFSSTPASGLSEISYSWWWRTSGTGLADYDPVFYDDGSANSTGVALYKTTGPYVFLFFRTSTGRLNLQGGSIPFSYNTTYYSNMTWHSTSDGGDGKIRFYLNGVLKYTSSAYSGNTAPIGSFHFAAQTSGATRYTPIIIDQFMILNHAMSQADIDEVYNVGNGIGIDSSYTYWDNVTTLFTFDNDVGSTMTNSKNATYNGVLVNSPSHVTGYTPAGAVETEVTLIESYTSSTDEIEGEVVFGHEDGYTYLDGKEMYFTTGNTHRADGLLSYYGSGNDSSITDTGSLMTINPDANGAGSRPLTIIGDVDLVTNDLTTTGTIQAEQLTSTDDADINDVLTCGSLVTDTGGITILAGQDIRPSANSTTAINIAQADGTDFVIFDTTNKFIGIGTTPGRELDVVANDDSSASIRIKQSSDGNSAVALLEAVNSSSNYIMMAKGCPSYTGGYNFSGDDGFLYNLTGNMVFQNVENLSEMIWANNGSSTPHLKLGNTGILQTYNKINFTQTDGNEYIDSLADGYLDLGATTGHRLLIGGTEQINLTDGKLAPTTDNDIDLGDATHRFKDIYATGATIYLGASTNNETQISHTADGLVIDDTEQDHDILVKINDGGTTRTAIQINGDEGSVTMPRQSFVHAYMSEGGAQTIAHTTTTTVIFDTEVTDVLGEYDTTTGIFTAKDDGVYNVATTVGWEAGTAGSYVTTITANTIGIVRAQFNGPTTIGRLSQPISATVKISAGQTIYISVVQTSGGNEILQTFTQGITALTITKVS